MSYMLMLCLTCKHIRKRQFFDWPLPVLAWFPTKSEKVAIWQSNKNSFQYLMSETASGMWALFFKLAIARITILAVVLM